MRAIMVAHTHEAENLYEMNSSLAVVCLSTFKYNDMFIRVSISFRDPLYFPALISVSTAHNLWPLSPLIRIQDMLILPVLYFH